MAFLAGCGAPPSPPANLVSIRLNPGHGDIYLATFDVTGLPADALESLSRNDLTSLPSRPRFTVRVHEGDDPLATSGDTPPMAGSLRVEDSVLRFRPKFPLQPGQRYRAIFDPKDLPGLRNDAGLISAIFTLPKPKEAPLAHILRVEPTGEKVPENLLRLYVHFSGPVERGDVYRHLSLLDEEGEPIDLPFLELGEELWDPSGTRLTLLFDPGRIKQGLVPRESAGPVLEAGHRYQMKIAPDGWLSADFQRIFDVGPADETPIDPKTWTIHPPSPGASEPLIVETHEPLDSAMMMRRLSVRKGDGKPLDGAVTLKNNAQVWEFRPETTWKAGRYALEVPRVLEDLAGNQVGRRFEVDILNPIPDAQPPAEIVEVPFTVQ
jgi:hypothetical protein